MNKDIMKESGHEKEMLAVGKNLCPSCLDSIHPLIAMKPLGEFSDMISIKEFRISGLCQKCQDNIFGK